MPNTDQKRLERIAALHAEGHGDRHIAGVLKITRHAVRAGLLQLAKGNGSGIVAAPIQGTRPGANAPASAWAAHIAACWRSSYDSILEVGQSLIAAKAGLGHGEFGKMIELSLPFGPNTAQRLMAIASDPKLSNPAHAPLLPPHWGTLYELTKIDDAKFSEAVEKKIIRPDMERAEIGQFVKAKRRAAREQILGVVQQSLPQKKFGVIVADPEWRFEPWSRKTGMDRAADNHYPTSCTEVIAARDVPSIAANDCVLFLWATAPMLPHALLVMEAWGFEYRSHCVWVKDRIGTGYWFRNQHELLLVGVKGEIPAPAMGTQSTSALAFDVGAHSAKPTQFLEMIEAYFPTLPKIELNRRGAPREGWDAWGLEAQGESTDAATISGRSERGLHV